jgi:D-alanine transaminase
MVAYLNGRYVDEDEATISPRDRGIQFADGAYEVIRSYNGTPFELEAHLARLQRSLRELRIEFDPPDDLGRVCRQLLSRNKIEWQPARVYMHVTRGTYKRGHGFPPRGTVPNIYAEVTVFEPDERVQERGVSVAVLPDQRWARCDIKSLALLPNVLAYQTARERGAFEAVLIRDGMVTEASHNSVGVVKDGTVIAPHLSNYVLPSITRQVVSRLCGENEVPFEEGIVTEELLRNADEAMLWGTGAEIAPIVRVDGNRVYNGKPGPITRKLQKAFRQYVSEQTGAPEGRGPGRGD